MELMFYFLSEILGMNNINQLSTSIFLPLDRRP